jgi:hypothetical protein
MALKLSLLQSADSNYARFTVSGKRILAAIYSGARIGLNYLLIMDYPPFIG